MQRHLNIRFIVLLVLVGTIAFFVISYAQLVIAEIAGYDDTESQRIAYEPLKKVDPIIAKGLYLTASSAANSKKRGEIIALINKTELNSVVIDIKDYSGNILYDSGVPLVNELGTERSVLKNIKTIIHDLRQNGVYVIARQTVFQDPALAKAKPEWAIKTADGSLWRDYKGLSWVDPTRTEVWDYNMAIAREAIKLGFNEINFDYVRFPSDGPIRQAVYADLRDNKAETMRAFFKYLQGQLASQPAYTSLDLFGMVLESKDFDLNIGQRLDTTVDTVDYIYPMTYPSHYPAGYLAMANPAEFPYEVVNNGLTKAAPALALSRTKLRPWIQAFDLGATYGADKIRAQIRAAEESPYTAGWMLWNAANRYNDAGLTAEK